MKFFGKEINKDRFLYTGLIFTFVLLYAVTAFVSFYHAITFFNIANAIWLSILLSFVAEIGQASVLFAILLTDNKHKFLPWAVMVILTTLQVIGNVVSSYDWIVVHNGSGVESFQKSILFWMTAADPEIFKVVIAWISGALLPIIALSMTALVAQNMELRAHDARTNLDEDSDQTHQENDVVPAVSKEIDAKDLISEVSKYRPTEEDFEKLEYILDLKKSKNKEDIIEEIKKEETTVEKETQIHGAPFDEPIYNPDVKTHYEDEDNEDIERHLDEEVELFSPDEIDNITPQPIKIPEKIKGTPSIENQEKIGHLTKDQLEKIRQLANENLKKK